MPEVNATLTPFISGLAGMADWLAEQVERAGPVGEVQRPAEGFCLREHTCHLRDLEREGYLVRVRRLLTEKEPALEPFFGDKVAAERDYMAQDAKLAAQEFAAARREVLGLLAATTPVDAQRGGTFAGEPITLGRVVAMMAEHDAEHRAEIERLAAEGSWK